jgi:uncharacterized protein involved in tolerance to divalent cations
MIFKRAQIDTKRINLKKNACHPYKNPNMIAMKMLLWQNK